MSSPGSNGAAASFRRPPFSCFDSYLRFGAGGKLGVPGDFLIRDQAGIGLDNGLWGLLRVLP